MTVYRAWMYQGWFTKWIPPNLAGKLSCEKKQNRHMNSVKPGFLVSVSFFKQDIGSSHHAPFISDTVLPPLGHSLINRCILITVDDQRTQ